MPPRPRCQNLQGAFAAALSPARAAARSKTTSRCGICPSSRPTQIACRQFSSNKRPWSDLPPTNSHQQQDSINSAGSVLFNVLGAGAGTAASTLLALYLAALVENSAHSTLHEYFPHLYDEIREEDLPRCIHDAEVSRRISGIREYNRMKGQSGEGLMGMDGWMDVDGEASESFEAEMLAEEQSEKEGGMPKSTMFGWQRRMTLKRASIIEKEEEEFLSLTSSSAARGDHQGSRTSIMQKAGLPDAKKIREEAARKLQERLMSAAMTA